MSKILPLIAADLPRFRGTLIPLHALSNRHQTPTSLVTHVYRVHFTLNEMDAHNASLQRLQALYKQLDLVDMVRRLLSDSTLQSSNVSATISLHDNLIRLRNWEREICVNTLPNFEVSNQNIVHILCGHVREIGNDLVAIKAALSNGDISGIE